MILMWIVTEATYYRWLQSYPDLLNFLIVLAIILLVLLAVALSVYLLINNWYRDQHTKLFYEVKHKRIYHYYRVGYISLATIYLIVVALGTVIFFTNVTWMDIINEIWNLEGIVILLNIYLLGLVLFYLIKYAILYRFKLKLSIMIPFILMILSMLANLYIMINVDFLTAIWTTMLAFIFFWVATAFELSSYKDAKKWPYFELAMTLITILIAVYGFNVNAMQLENPGSNLGHSEIDDSDEYDYSSEALATEESEFGTVTISKSDEMGYLLNIDGEYDASATYYPDAYMITITNPNTSERINLQIPTGNSEETYVYYDIVIITSQNADTINYKQCNSNINVNGKDKVAVVEEILNASCLTKEQIDNVMPLFEYILNTYDKYAEY